MELSEGKHCKPKQATDRRDFGEAVRKEEEEEGQPTQNKSNATKGEKNATEQEGRCSQLGEDLDATKAAVRQLLRTRPHYSSPSNSSWGLLRSVADQGSRLFFIFFSVLAFKSLRPLFATILIAFISILPCYLLSPPPSLS